MTDALVSCAVGSVEYALRADDIVAVMRAERMRPPAAGEAGIGVVTVGAERAPVYALSTTLEVSQASGDGPAIERDRHIVVLRGAGTPVGWLVDRVSRSRLPSPTRVLPLPAIVGSRAKRWFAGVISTGDRTMLLLSLAASSLEPIVADAPSVGATGTDTPLVVTFSTSALPDCGTRRCAISARRVAAVESGLAVVSVPGSDLPVVGVSVWRGEVVPVVDVAASRSARDVETRRLLIVRCGGTLAGTPIAIPVDAETALCPPTHEHQRVAAVRVGAQPLPAFVVGLFDIRGQKVALIDPDALFDSGEAPGAKDGECSAPGRASTIWTREDRRTRG